MANGAEFIDKLIDIGYPNAKELNSASFDFLFYNKKLKPFLEWICTNTSSANVIPHPELTRYNQLVESSEKIFEVEELEELGSLRPDYVFSDIITNRDNVEEAQLRAKALDKRERILFNFKKSLKTQQLAIFEDCARLENDCATANLRRKLTMVDCEKKNRSLKVIQTSIETLSRKVFDVLRLSAPSSNVWLFAMNFEPLWRNSYDGTMDVLSRMQKTFNMSDVEQAKHLERNNQLRQIIRSGHIKCELALYRTESKHEGMKSAFAEARKILAFMDLGSVTWKTHSLRNTKSVGELAADNSSLFDDEILPKVVRKCDFELDFATASQFSLKRKRLAYYMVMLEKAISQLISIETTIRFVLIAVDMELTHITKIGSFIDDLTKSLQIEVNSLDGRKRKIALFSSSLPKPRSTCQETVSLLARILEIDASCLSDVDKLAAIQRECGKLEDERVNQWDALDSRFKQEISLITDLDCSLNLLISCVWNDCTTHTEVPPLTPPAITEALNQIISNSQKVENNLLRAMKDHQDKMTLLSADELLLIKRKLYAYFYVDPEKFKRTWEAIRCKKTKA